MSFFSGVSIWKIAQKLGASEGSDSFKMLEEIFKQASTVVDSVPFLIGQYNQTTQSQLSWQKEEIIQWCSYNQKSCDVE